MAIGKNDGVFEGDKPNPFLPLNFQSLEKKTDIWSIKILCS